MGRRNPRRNITRVESESHSGRCHGGWEVRIQRQRIKRSRYFADAIYGGKLAALREAKKHRDQLEVELGKMNVAQRATTPSIRNHSGVVGVRRHQQKDRRGDFVYLSDCWIAQWTDGHGRRKTRSFSVGKFGEDEAFRLACEARDAGVATANR